MRNIILSRGTTADINNQVEKVLRGLGNPEPPLRLEDVREVLKLDRRYYSTSDDGFLRETISKLTVAGTQIMKRPGLILDAVRKLDLRALYLPDRKRILLDSNQPGAKQRWNEAHEIGHSIVPWHNDLMLGDQDQTLTPACHLDVEAEANYAAGQLLFLRSRFRSAANDTTPSLDAVRALKGEFGNTYTTTFWRYIEDSHQEVPMFGMIGQHPRFPKNTNDPLFRHVVESPAYEAIFDPVSLDALQKAVRSYCKFQKGGPLGAGEVIVVDKRGESHIFLFETFSNTHDCLTFATYKRPYARVVGH